jgi:hypothetical protein
LLAEETGLTLRSVGTHTRLATAAGWIVSKLILRPGKKWANNHYIPLIPKSATPSAHGSTTSPECGAVRVEPGAVQQERDDRPVRKDVPTNTTESTTENITKNSEGYRKFRKQMKSLLDLGGDPDETDASILGRPAR